MALREFIRSLLIVPVILIFWRCPLYYGDAKTGEVSGVLRSCYEIFGAAKEAQINPPSFIVNFCSMQLPRKFEMEVAVNSSSIVAIQRHVERYLYLVQREGFLAYMWKGLCSLEELIVLTEAANWIRLLPSMLVSSPQLRGGLFIFYVMVFLRSIPVSGVNIGYGAHLLAAVALLDWTLAIKEEIQEKMTMFKSASEDFKAQMRRSILKQEAIFFAMQVFVPVFLVSVTVMMMMTLAYIIETYS